MIPSRFIVFLFTFLWISGFLSPLSAAEMTSQSDLFRQKSQEFTIRGVYHLINKNNPDAAESEFRQAVVLDQQNGEAYYFLGRIYYERALSIEKPQQSIGKAKALLLRAQKLGVTYDKLHPNLLKKMQQKYTKVAPIYEDDLFPKKAKIIIETEQGKFDIKASRMNQDGFVIATKDYPPYKKIQLESGASYKLEFMPQKRIYKHLILIGIGLAVWLIR